MTKEMVPWQHHLCVMAEIEHRHKSIRADAAYPTDERDDGALSHEPRVPARRLPPLRHRCGLLLIAAGVAPLDRPRDVANSA